MRLGAVREWGPVVRRGAQRALPTVVRLVSSVAVAALLGSPLAVSWAVTHTSVQAAIGTTPATFTLTTRGHSELRLGIAGTVFVPVSRGPIGVVATVDGPGDPGTGDGDLASYVRPEMLELYAGLFHDPEPAVQEYVDLVLGDFWRRLLIAELTVAGVGGLMLFALATVFPLRNLPPGQRKKLRVALVCGVVLSATTALAAVQLRPDGRDAGPEEGAYTLPALEDTIAAGSTTNSPVLRALSGGALAKARQLIDRQEEQEEVYRASAEEALEAQALAMAGPRDGEIAVMMQSDMHCNTTMIRLQRMVFSMLQERFGEDVPALLAISGDLTTNGTAAEGECIDNEREIAGQTPVAAVTGNHESDVSDRQMRDAGMTVLDGAVEEVGGVSVLGDGDPSRSEFFGETRLRGDETQEDMGARLYEEATSDRPDLVLVHEAYAAQAFLDAAPMRTFLEEGGSTTTAYDDGVRDVPAGAVFYGHWHRSEDPRVVWNSDGTWTLVMELDTSGGAIGAPTLGNFSTPWSRPQQQASFPVIFLDSETRLVTGYQIYRFATDASVTVLPRVDVGATTSPAAPGGP
jgi:Icc-related predicted phosphoesterase